MNLTNKSRPILILLRSPSSFRCYASEEKPPQPPPPVTSSAPKKLEENQDCPKVKLDQAQSYEKWLKSFQKETLFKIDNVKCAINNWRKGQASTEEWYQERVSFWMKRYENFVGLTEVKAGQALVVKEERLFIAAQEQRRENQTSLNDVQSQLKSLRTELERTPRGDDKYLELLTEEHKIIKEEFSLVSDIQRLERLEREKFSKLSRAVRDSHEKERAQAEKTKYWSVLGSVIGTCLGVFGTTVNNRLRMRELRQIVTDSTKIHSANLENMAASASVGGAASATSAAATAALVMPVLEDQQKQLKNVSENFINLVQGLDSKIGQLVETLRNQPAPIVKVSSPKVDLSSDFKGLEKGLAKNNANLTEVLGKIITIRDEKLMEALKTSNSDSYNTFSSRVCDIEEKVKDIRSLLLAQAMNSSDTVISSSVKNHETAKAVERSNQSVLGTVELALRDHEERLSGHIIATGVVVAVLVQVLSFAVSKLF